MLPEEALKLAELCMVMCLLCLVTLSSLWAIAQNDARQRACALT